MLRVVHCLGTLFSCVQSEVLAFRLPRPCDSLRHESTSKLQACMEGHQVAITGAVSGSTSCQLQEGAAQIDISNLKAANPAYASTAPKDLSGAVCAVPVSVYCTNETADSIQGLGVLMTSAGSISCVILPGDLLCFKKPSRAAQFGMVSAISWSRDQGHSCSRQASDVKLEVEIASAATSSRPQKQEISLAMVLSMASWLSASDYHMFFPDEEHSYACPAATCLKDEHGRWQNLLSRITSSASPIPAWKRLEVLVQKLGSDLQIQSAICR